MMLNSLATLEQLEPTPSMNDGLPHHLEMELRALGCQIIQQTGVLLRLPQRTAAVAQVFFHRFWYVSSMADFSANEIALGCLLLSTKLEETQVVLRHLVNAFHSAMFHLQDRIPPEDRGRVAKAASSQSSARKYRPLAYNSGEYERLRECAMVAEMQILKRLGFNVQVVLPHALLPNYLQALGLASSDLQISPKIRARRPPDNAKRGDTEPSLLRMSFAQFAWSFLNDALQTPVLCLFGPHVVACAAIALAADLCVPRVKLPVDPAPWWLVFDASEPEIRIACSHVLWRYHHRSSLATAPLLLDRQVLREHVVALSADAEADPVEVAARSGPAT
ncbi:cyclin L [Moesziomyces antarcticus T-34]|uniref:Cyclin L n=1 Tax=Pseudozyma antarctica (strain T-34) TaxID=1151754 RepID=M9MEE9_PSEA3|nr:cyclin L [Moesziomyces antarcticus T-34]